MSRRAPERDGKGLVRDIDPKGLQRLTFDRAGVGSDIYREVERKDYSSLTSVEMFLYGILLNRSSRPDQVQSSLVVSATSPSLRGSESSKGTGYPSMNLASESSKGTGYPSMNLASESSKGTGYPSMNLACESSKGAGYPSMNLASESSMDLASLWMPFASISFQFYLKRRSPGGQEQQPLPPTVVPNHKSNHPNPTSPEEAPRKMVEMEIYRHVPVLSEETLTRTSGGQAQEPPPSTMVPNHKKTTPAFFLIPPSKKRPPTSPSPLKPAKSLHLLPTVTAVNDPRGSSEITNRSHPTSPEEAPRKMVEMEIYRRGLTSTQGPSAKDPFPVLSEETLTRTSGGQAQPPPPLSTSPEEAPRKMVEIEIYRRDPLPQRRRQEKMVEMEIYRRGLTSSQGPSPKDPFPVLSEETLTRTSGGQAQPPPPNLDPLPQRKRREKWLKWKSTVAIHFPRGGAEKTVPVLSEETLTRTSGGQAQQPPPHTMVSNHKIPVLSEETLTRTSGGQEQQPPSPTMVPNHKSNHPIPVLSEETLTRTSGGQAQQPPPPTMVPNHKSNHPSILPYPPPLQETTPNLPPTSSPSLKPVKSLHLPPRVTAVNDPRGSNPLPQRRRREKWLKWKSTVAFQYYLKRRSLERQVGKRNHLPPT
ncbi:ras-associated and pleckstrin homology domains-containing protein 1-like [Palaemon carinicauda]|uniref:ras-associated and pleckstrin homology domains-containing protein 1-like n=1 Tax=Palaemon carinicauda TaxID=392227 RepID=UPI0035B5C0EB